MTARKQLPLALAERPTWGGKRKGAGRKLVGRRSVPHCAREALDRRHPVHVTLRVGDAIGNLRTKHKVRAIRQVLRDMLGSELFRVVHFSVQSTHVHLLVEAEDKIALSRGVLGFEIRAARRLNKLAHRKGNVFSTRYHARALKTPRETRNGLAYVLLNGRHHARSPKNGVIDACSSGEFFNGWSKPCRLASRAIDDDPVKPVSVARTWLLSTGWRAKHPPISPDEIPGAQ